MKQLPTGLFALALALPTVLASGADPAVTGELVFPLHPQHNHAPGIVECPNGDLLVSWYRGSGERKADDVALHGARKRKGAKEWGESFLLFDTPGFPDGNTAMHIDAAGKLWLFWPVVVANTWESCLTSWLESTDYTDDGCPKWTGRGTMYLKPRNFVRRMAEGLEERRALGKTEGVSTEWLTRRQALIEDKLSQRMGWQGRCKPTVLPGGRILLPLYSDTYDVGLMAISDDGGTTWKASEPLAGWGSIQPSVCRRKNGTLVAYMRENGPLDRIRVAESTDDGMTWGPVGVSELPNPGAGVDAVVLSSGRWLIVYNDTTGGRRSLAVSLSDDEGRTWKHTRHLEKHDAGAYHYPAVIQGKDGIIHCVYSYFVAGGKSMKHAAFRESWLRSR